MTVFGAVFCVIVNAVFCVRAMFCVVAGAVFCVVVGAGFCVGTMFCVVIGAGFCVVIGAVFVLLLAPCFVGAILRDSPPCLCLQTAPHWAPCPPSWPWWGWWAGLEL